MNQLEQEARVVQITLVGDDGQATGDYDECRLLDLVAENRDAPDVVADLMRLRRVGSTVRIGGGAAPLFQVTVTAIRDGRL